jgi:drug/metabolite transporter (DMT)-like permease
VIAGLLLAVSCALAGSVGVLLKQRGAVAAPTVLGRHPLRSAIGLFACKWWTVAWLVALGAWMLHVAALSLAPLSIVQAVISGGLVFVAILAERFFGFHLGRRQWIGLLVTAVGLAILGNIVALLGGIPVFHDPIGRTPPEIAARIVAFCLVIFGAALPPGRLRAAAPTADASRAALLAPAIAMLHQAGS